MTHRRRTDPPRRDQSGHVGRVDEAPRDVPVLRRRGLQDRDGAAARASTRSRCVSSAPSRAKSLLHLQCHFGLDTIAWAQRGAAATGVDFSTEAIAAARALAAEMRRAGHVHRERPVRAARAPRRHVRHRLHVARRAAVAARPGGVGTRHRRLSPAGRHVLHHRGPSVCDDLRRYRSRGPSCVRRDPYFHSPAPERSERRGSYAAPDAPIDSVTYQWAHSMADILGALLRAGLARGDVRGIPIRRMGDVPLDGEAAGRHVGAPGRGADHSAHVFAHRVEAVMSTASRAVGVAPPPDRRTPPSVAGGARDGHAAGRVDAHHETGLGSCPSMCSAAW